MNFVFPTVKKIKKPAPSVKIEGSDEVHQRNSAFSRSVRIEGSNEFHQRNSAVSRMAALENDNEKLKLKVEAITKAFANYVTKTDFESQESLTNMMILELQNFMTAEKEDAGKMTQIVMSLKEDLKSKTDENRFLRSEIEGLKSNLAAIEVQVEKNKKKERISCKYCEKLCNSDNSFKKHMIAKHRDLENLNKT